MIDVRGLRVAYGDTTALRGLTLHVAPGESVLVTGPSGCGKSTLARALCGLIPHAIPAQIQGSVHVAGKDVGSHSVAELARQVGTVFQNPTSQLFHLRAEEEVAFGLRNLGLPAERIPERVRWALSAVGLDELADGRPSELSTGQKQRLVIAAAIAMKPQALILDEPTASLDVPGTRAVIGTLRKLRREVGLTLVLMEHCLAEALRVTDRVVVVDQGRILREGAPATVLEDRGMLCRLGIRRPAEGPIRPWEKLLRPEGPPPAGAEPLLALEGVSAGYDGCQVLHEIDLEIYPGEFVALVGDNGAGKTTLGLVAAGLLRPSTGRLRFAGDGRPRGGRDVAMLFQNPADQLFTNRVGEEVAFGPCNFNRFDPQAHERTLARSDLLGLRDRAPSRLSAGQQQRTALAACLALRPRLLILDEPTLGQDWGHLERLMDLVAELHREGTAVLLSTHDYKLVHRYAKRVVLLEKGRVQLDGALREGSDVGGEAEGAAGG
jgi:energy-coupling factor transport system ATP-binding protein